VVGVQTASESLPLASLPFKKHTHDQTFGWKFFYAWQCKIRLGWFVSYSKSHYYLKRFILSTMVLTNPHFMNFRWHGSHVTLKAIAQA
jgi:hypothetical protein